ncbi:hypothetical protein PUNSTDRAFT_140643 [Punctularia strigosozonata HHB-11173 SS5]|uniref:uncharacterized protein n=1 Tax=Punctularia strigosozonata (strain HHB-11173) TaxID=741275 RepID=UPI0004416EB0|nr:uncharacterized protein PUNSTDRAFT_140643 [Punctularia strigosozonata HHB-11173 SS5]EIN14326.1 hypothetical protein PUNSTDRAFT_140643 [Punctularia strigosozonata HHB-11173 SS5]
MQPASSSSRSPRPRPILKQDSSDSSESSESDGSNNPFPFATCSNNAVNSSHVRFPPTPKLSCAQVTYSPYQYDRAPIHVSPNVCALPDRHERDYKEQRCRRTGRDVPKGSYFHPRAYEACHIESAGTTPPAYDPPPLVLDVSSESDDSPVTTPPDPRSRNMPPRAFHQFSSGPMSPPIYPPGITPQDNVTLGDALTFLPHPPTAPGKERSGRKRSSTPGPKLKRMPKFGETTTSSFSSPGLDGCLGGF